MSWGNGYVNANGVMRAASVEVFKYRDLVTRVEFWTGYAHYKDFLRQRVHRHDAVAQAGEKVGHIGQGHQAA